MRTVEVLGFNDECGKETGKNLGSGICALDLPSNETILLQVNEGVIMNTGKTLLSVNQVCHFGHIIDDCPKRYGGTQAITTTQGRVLPLSYRRALCRIAMRKPTKKELASYGPKELTNPMEWNPTLEYDSDTTLDHHLASANTLLPVPIGEGGFRFSSKKHHHSKQGMPAPLQKGYASIQECSKGTTRHGPCSKMSWLETYPIV